jgi:hypothetical protein
LPEPQLVEERRFGEARYTFRQPEKYLPFSGNVGNNVELALSPLVPNTIQVKSNTGSFDIDLSQINVPLLEIETGAAKISVGYGAVSSNKTYLKTTAASITLLFPIESQVEIKIDSAAKNLNLDESRFVKNGNTYKTNGFEQASSKIQIEISGSAANIEIK